MTAVSPGVPLQALVAVAARWTGERVREAGHTRAVVADLWDRMAWREVNDQVPDLRHLVDRLTADTDHAADLVCDLWTALYQHQDPAVRPAAQMAPSRALNHRAAGLLLADPAFTTLRAATRGDAVAAALALSGQGGAVLGDLLEAMRTAQRHADAAARSRADADAAARRVKDRLWEAAAAADGDGMVPTAHATAVEEAVTDATAADRAAKTAQAKAGTAARRSGDRLARTMSTMAREAAADTLTQRRFLATWNLTGDRLDPRERADLARRLDGPALRRLADLIGRFHAMTQAERAERIPGAGGEIVGITLLDDLSRAVPGELAAFAVPALRADLIARMVEGRLLGYENRGEQRVGRGPLIICLDASYSMNYGSSMNHGPTGPGMDAPTTRHEWAKALTLTLLGRATDSRPPRAAAVLRFAGQILSRHHFPAGPPNAAELFALCEAGSPGMSTNYRPPLEAALELVETTRTEHPELCGADIVFITDGEHGDADWLTDFKARKTTSGTRIFGVAIADEPSPVLRSISDHVHTITDLTDPGTTRDILNTV